MDARVFPLGSFFYIPMFLGIIVNIVNMPDEVFLISYSAPKTFVARFLFRVSKSDFFGDILWLESNR
jgi:hypothetical protein